MHIDGTATNTTTVTTAAAAAIFFIVTVGGGGGVSKSHFSKICRQLWINVKENHRKKILRKLQQCEVSCGKTSDYWYQQIHTHRHTQLSNQLDLTKIKVFFVVIVIKNNQEIKSEFASEFMPEHFYRVQFFLRDCGLECDDDSKLVKTLYCLFYNVIVLLRTALFVIEIYSR